tara:strand:- start:4959 stop:6287 length:1329 start_codon:yes stop_codon:yes gene_type:complete
MNKKELSKSVAIVGGGLTGMSAAFELAKAGHKVTIFEADDDVGGLAGSFSVKGAFLEKFYHHWFNNDKDILKLIDDLGETKKVKRNYSRTGMYYANSFFKLSSPLDLLRLKALPFWSRIRLGIGTLYVQNIRNWEPLEKHRAIDWLPKVFGKTAYDVIWKPLLIGKFGDKHMDVSAVWFWNKIKLRGGSRGKEGKEELLYYEGGFKALVSRFKSELINLGVDIKLGFKISSLELESNQLKKIINIDGTSFTADKFLFAIPPQIIGSLLQEAGEEKSYYEEFNSIPYLANVCLVLVLDKKLSDLYWINVNDPNFPFVAFIEHTNFESSSSYNGKTLVYLSKYLSDTDKLYKMTAEELTSFSIPFIKEMFPDFSEQSIEESFLWKERHAQPLVTINYSKIKPSYKTKYANLLHCHMTHIYPEDRGTNYAVREGRKVGILIANDE